MNSKTLLLSFALVSAAISSPALAQCNSFAKKKCIPELAPYIHNGQLNSAMLMAGETAELQLTFYSGQEYRIMVCGQENLGDINFKLKDASNNVIFNSADQKSKKKFWDFNLKSTQQFNVEVSAPESNSPNESNSGCISVIVGFKAVNKP